MLSFSLPKYEIFKRFHLENKLNHGEEKLLLFLIVKPRGKSITSFIPKPSRLSQNTSKRFANFSPFQPLAPAISQAVKICEFFKGYVGVPATLLHTWSQVIFPDFFRFGKAKSCSEKTCENRKSCCVPLVSLHVFASALCVLLVCPITEGHKGDTI